MKCTKYVGNYKKCGKPAVYRVLCHNGKDYEFYCEHCAEIVRRWGGNDLELMQPMMGKEAAFNEEKEKK